MAPHTVASALLHMHGDAGASSRSLVPDIADVPSFLPHYPSGHDGTSEAFFDTFTLVYWGLFMVVLLIVEYIAIRFPSVRKDSLTGRSRASSGRSLGKDEEAAEDDAREVVLPETMWSLLVVANVRQAKFPGGSLVPVWFVTVLCLLMACLQLFTITLVVHDLNPNTNPITNSQTLTSPWKNNPWTVNSCKWLMVFFYTAFLTSDAGQFMACFKEHVCLHGRHTVVPRCVVVSIGCVQYIVLTYLVFCGVAAIMSMHAVPDIIYSSLAMTFIAHIDDIVWTSVFSTMFAVEADFKIKHWPGDESQVPTWLEILLRGFMVGPLAFGFFILSHAWTTETIPTEPLRRLLRFLWHCVS